MVPFALHTTPILRGLSAAVDIKDRRIIVLYSVTASMALWERKHQRDLARASEILCQGERDIGQKNSPIAQRLLM